MTPATSDAGRVVACVQHGNSFLEINNGHKRFAVTVPVEIASAVKQDAATLSALQRKLEDVMRAHDDSARAANFRQCGCDYCNVVRALLGGDATTNEDS